MKESKRKKRNVGPNSAKKQCKTTTKKGDREADEGLRTQAGAYREERRDGQPREKKR